MEIKLQKVLQNLFAVSVEPHFDGCPVKVVQFYKLHNREPSVFVISTLCLNIVNRNFRYKEKSL